MQASAARRGETSLMRKHARLYVAGASAALLVGSGIASGSVSAAASASPQHLTQYGSFSPEG
ncbi:MAG: hypothetical protein ABR541_02615, partial [Candidatus Dormibacteria bacterium]